MICDALGCTGKHGSNNWREMCPGARERKRARQRAWVSAKYWNNRGWANEKRWANLYYKSSSAGIISQCKSAARARELQLELLMSAVPRSLEP